MEVFKNYAGYYDLLYKTKDYFSEVDYVDSLIKKNKPDCKNILSLGCGTGKHDFIFSERGYRVMGVDLSSEMIDVAQKEKNKKGDKNVTFQIGDIRNFRTEEKFDVVISLFHVFSYQTNNEDLENAFDTAIHHLKPSGIFIFDCWYGPGVLSDPPVVRVKKLENKTLEVTRIAEPSTHANENVVDVTYHVIIREKESNNYSELRETHSMRFLFLPELKLIFEKKGLQLLEFQEWMSGRTPTLNSWNVCFVLRK